MTEQVKPHVRVEFDPEYQGGGYDKVGQFAYVPVDLADQLGSVEAAFSQQTGQPASAMINYSPDELYDAAGNEYEEPEAQYGSGPSM